MVKRTSRVVAGLMIAGLLGMTAACGTSDDSTSGNTSAAGAESDAGATAAAATKKPAAKKVDATVTGTGMKAGCESVRKLFAAIDAGDADAAKTLKGKGHELFNDVAAASATTNMDLAMDGASMSTELEYELPDGPTRYRSNLAKQYGAICVTKHKAAPLAG